jgi:hypothetical protein
VSSPTALIQGKHIWFFLVRIFVKQFFHLFRLSAEDDFVNWQFYSVDDDRGIGVFWVAKQAGQVRQFNQLSEGYLLGSRKLHCHSEGRLPRSRGVAGVL